MLNTLMGNMIFTALFLLSAQYSIAGEKLDIELREMSLQPQAVAKGEQGYRQMCVACHARDLSGASGFNLKDGEWVHGDRPSQILNNIKNGFPEKGMPGFASVVSEEALKPIVSYLLSKREGFEDLSFKLYEMENDTDRVISDDKLVKVGQLNTNLVDFHIPQIHNFVLEFEGTFYVPGDEAVRLWMPRARHIDIQFEIDGEPMLSNVNGTNWWLKSGKQHLKIIYRSAKEGESEEVLLMAVNKDNSIKLFPVSKTAKSSMLSRNDATKSIANPVIQRKKIHGLPAYSIGVGFPEQINAAFNSESCNIVGVWSGDFLNVGPNIDGRGRDGSLQLGDWLFKSPQTLGVKGTADSLCAYSGYRTQPNPEFKYVLDGVEYRLQVHGVSSNTIQFNYQTNATGTLEFTLPQIPGLKWESEQGRVEKGAFIVGSGETEQFSISATLSK